MVDHMRTHNEEPPESWFSSAFKAFLSIPSSLLGTTNEFTDIAIDLSAAGPFRDERRFILEAHKDIIKSLIRGFPTPGPNSTPWLLWALQFYTEESKKVEKLNKALHGDLQSSTNRQFGHFIF